MTWIDDAMEKEIVPALSSSDFDNEIWTRPGSVPKTEGTKYVCDFCGKDATREVNFSRQNEEQIIATAYVCGDCWFDISNEDIYKRVRS